MRYNSGAVVLPKHARRLPGMMQTANKAKRGSAASSQNITQTFGLFRESLGCTRLQQHGNDRFRGPGGMPCPCPRARLPAPAGLPAPPRRHTRWHVNCLRARRLAPLPACSDFFDFPQICAMRSRGVVFFWLKEGRQGDLRQRNAIDAGRPANVQRRCMPPPGCLRRIFPFTCGLQTVGAPLFAMSSLNKEGSL